MKKLFKLREWLTLDEASEYLALVLDEDVDEKDIYRLALDGNLTLSVDFVNNAYVKKGKIVGFDEVEYFEMDDLPITRQFLLDNFKARMKNQLDGVVKSLHISDDRFLNLQDEIEKVDGIWDLTMFGGEKLDIEHRYQTMTGGPEVTVSNLYGAFVEKGGVVCQIQESFEQNEFYPGSLAQKELLENEILLKEHSKVEEKELRDRFNSDRKKYFEKRKNNPSHENYFPSAGLPEDSALIVRVTALEAFLKSLGEEHSKPLVSRERHTLLILIAALCKEANIDYSQRGISTAVQHLTENIGAPVSDDTIRGILKQIDNALDVRGK